METSESFATALWRGREVSHFNPFMPAKDHVFGGEFSGLWQEKHPRNFPGPFYSTTSNLSSLAACSEWGSPDRDAPDAPRLILWSNEPDGIEWIWRQPRDASEVRRLLLAMSHDEVASYACDGNRHWDLASIRQWWRERDPILAWARDCLRSTVDDGDAYTRGVATAGDHSALRALLEYYEGSAARDLRRYAFFLSEGRLPRAEEATPEL